MIETHAFASGAEIREIIEAMEPALANYPADHVLMACIALSLTILEPSISVDQLVRGVEEASHWMSKFTSHLDDDMDDLINLNMPPEKMN